MIILKTIFEQDRARRTAKLREELEKQRKATIKRIDRGIIVMLVVALVIWLVVIK